MPINDPINDLQLIRRAPRIEPLLPEISRRTISLPARRATISTWLSPGALLVAVVGIITFMLALELAMYGLLVAGVGIGLMVLPLTWQLYRVQQSQLRHSRRVQAYLELLREEKINLQRLQREYYQYFFPDLSVTLSIARHEVKSRLGDDLWSRGVSHPFFACLRLGVGTIPARIAYEAAPLDGTEAPELVLQLQQHIRDSQWTDRVPLFVKVALPNSPDPQAQIYTTLGLCYRGVNTGGKQHLNRYLHHIMLQLLTFHAPHDMSVFYFGGEDDEGQWHWLKQIPHLRASEVRTHFYIEYAGLTELKEYHKRLTNGIETFLQEGQRRLRLLREQEGIAPVEIRHPLLFAIFNLKGEVTPPLLYSQIDTIAALVSEHGAELGLAAIFVADTLDHLPDICAAYIELEQLNRDQYVFHLRSFHNQHYMVGNANLAPSLDIAINFANWLQNYRLRQSSLPNALSLLELYHASTIEALDIATRWQQAPPGREGMKARIGVTAQGNPLEVFFANGLISGVSGAGKSESLISLISALALEYSPARLNFITIDWKMGGVFYALQELPHLIDTVSWMYEHQSVQRFLALLRAEADRRAKLLASHNNSNIVEYYQYGHDTHPPLPYLLVVIDLPGEVSELQAEFMAGITGLMRISRAIGIRFLIAAEQPQHTVPTEMLPFIHWRLCFRTNSSQESQFMIGRTDAVHLPPYFPGRGYLKTGDDAPVLLQAAYTSGSYMPVQEDAPAVIWLDQDMLGEAISEVSLAQAIQLEINHLNKLLAIHPQHKPYPDPLPSYLSLDLPLDTTFLDVADEQTILAPSVALWRQGQGVWQEQLDDKQIVSCIGLMDDPASARRHLLALNFSVTPHILIAGGAGVGKTMLLSTIITDLISTYSPRALHLHILDFDRDFLEIFERLPHCGNYLANPHETHLGQRFITWLNYEINQRWLHRQTFPAIFVIIDNFPAMLEAFAHIEEWINACRSGAGVNVHFVVSTFEETLIDERLRQHFGKRLHLGQASIGESPYSPGSGQVNVTADLSHQLLNFQAALPLGAAQATAFNQRRLLAEYIATMTATWQPDPANAPARIRLLPEVLTWVEMDTASPLPHDQEGVLAIVGQAAERIVQIENFALELQAGNLYVIGRSRAGKTGFIETLILALAHRYSPSNLQVYLLDFSVSPSNSRLLETLPQMVDTALRVIDSERIEKLFIGLKKIFLERRQLLVDANTEHYAVYNQRFPDTPITSLLVVIDSYSDFALRNQKVINKDFALLLQDGQRYGIKFVITTSHYEALASDLRSHFPQQIALHMEAGDYRLLNRTDITETRHPGRAYLMTPLKVTELQIAQVSADHIRERLPAIQQQWAKYESPLKRYFENAQPPFFFINYRIADSSAWADRIRERLVAHWGEDQVFLDIQKLEKGKLWEDMLRDALKKCTALIALIGKDWLDARNSDGQRRLDDPTDWVRIEIETSMERGITLIPTLVGGASIPDVSQLSGKLKDLFQYQVQRIDRDSFDEDIESLIKALERG